MGSDGPKNSVPPLGIEPWSLAFRASVTAFNEKSKMKMKILTQEKCHCCLLYFSTSVLFDKLRYYDH